MTKDSFIKSGFRRRHTRYVAITTLLGLLCITLCLTALMVGNTFYKPDVVLSVLSGDDIKGASFAIVTLRLPRMLAGLLVGLAFGLAGSTFQTMLRNPLASPDIIGVTSGSSVAAVFCILLLNISGSLISLISVLSGLLVAALIYTLSKGGSFSGGRLILVGIGVQAMLNAIISFLLLRASQYDVPAAMRWLSGSLNGIRLSQIQPLLIVVLIFGTLLLLLGKVLKILELGEQSAITLGIKTDSARLMLVLCAVFLVAFGTAVTGPISFISFLAGPIAARLVGRSANNLLPAGLVGACLVIGSDLIGQFAFDTRFPVGIITGIIGAPYLMLLLIQMNRRGGTA